MQTMQSNSFYRKIPLHISDVTASIINIYTGGCGYRF